MYLPLLQVIWYVLSFIVLVTIQNIENFTPLDVIHCIQKSESFTSKVTHELGAYLRFL